MDPTEVFSRSLPPFVMSIVDLAKIAESYKMEAELEDELLQGLRPNVGPDVEINLVMWCHRR